jgi:hypothetical protein
VEEAVEGWQRLQVASAAVRDVQMCSVGQNYIYIYDFFGREITRYTVIYGVYIRFWPTLHMCLLYVWCAHDTRVSVFMHVCVCMCVYVPACVCVCKCVWACVS